jgi:hypothetical protein
MQTWVVILIVLLLLGGAWWWYQQRKQPAPPHPAPTPTNRLSHAQLLQYARVAVRGDASGCEALLQQWGIPTASYGSGSSFNYLGAWQALSWLTQEQLGVLNGLRMTSNQSGCQAQLLQWGVYPDFLDSSGNFDCNAAYEYYNSV